MPERTRLADREQEEALRRSSHAEGDGAAAPAFDEVAALRRIGAGLGSGSAGPVGGSRAMSPSTLLAMQRLAGNRATVQLLARPPRSNPLEGLGDAEDDEAMAGDAGSGGGLASAKEADVAAGPPDAGGTAGGGGGSGDAAPPGGAPNASGGSAGSKAGEVASGGAGAMAGAAAGGVGAAAGEAAAGGIGAAAGRAAAGKAGEAAAGGIGAAAGRAAAGKAGEAAAGGIGAAAGRAAAGKAGEAAGGVGAAAGGVGAAAGAAAAGKAGEAAGGAAGGVGAAAGAAAAGKAGGVGAAGGKARKTERPPIVAGGEAAGKAGELAAGEAGAAVASQKAGAAGAPAAGGAGGNAISVEGGPGAGRSGGGAGGNAISVEGGPGAGSGTSRKAAPAPATAPGSVPDPATASTGVDWGKMLSDYGPPARTVLEVTRLVPGWGLLGGLAADSINFASDVASIPNSQNADLATGLIVFRNLVNIGNNGLGHILYVNQLIQDGLAGSVVGAEFTPLTAAANEALSTVKVVLDEVQMGTDIVVEVEAIYESNHAPTSAEADQWKALADGYAANILGDVVNLVLDVISLSSAGAANTAPVQQGRQPLTLAAAFMKNATPNIISAVNGVLGVWLGSLVTEGRQAYVGSPTDLRNQALGLDAAGLVVDAEGPQARMTYDGINAVIDALGAYADDQIAQINLVAEALSGGKSAFQLIRDAVTQSLDDMNRKLTMVQELGAAASNGQTNAAAISAACASVLGALDALVLPDVTLESVDLGEGVLADAAEAIAGEAAEAANAAIRQAMSGVSAALESAKDTLRGPVQAAQERADSLGEWLALLATQCTAMVGTLSAHIAKFSDGLGKCTSIEQVIDLIIGQVSDLTGMPRVTVAEIRAAWNSIGPYIDRFVALGPRMHDRATDLRAHADLLEAGGEAGGTAAPPPEPPPGQPPNPDKDAAALAAVA